jgi:hypothetical protein
MAHERNGEGDGGRSEQKMDELCAGKIGRERRSGRNQDEGYYGDRDQDRIGQRTAAQGRRDGIRNEIGNERRCEPEQRRAREINP